MNRIEFIRKKGSHKLVFGYDLYDIEERDIIGVFSFFHNILDDVYETTIQLHDKYQNIGKGKLVYIDFFSQAFLLDDFDVNKMFRSCVYVNNERSLDLHIGLGIPFIVSEDGYGYIFEYYLKEMLELYRSGGMILYPPTN